MYRNRSNQNSCLATHKTYMNNLLALLRSPSSQSRKCRVYMKNNTHTKPIATIEYQPKWKSSQPAAKLLYSVYFY